MKKILGLLGLLLLCGIFCACSSSDDEETEKKLGYYVANGKVYLAVPAHEKTLYIQIYRKDADGNIFNIGQIRPTLLNTMVSYTFEDELVANKKYQYMAMYYQFPDYEITDWTDDIFVYGSKFDSEPAPVVEENVYFDFDSETLKLKLKNGNICFPDKTKNEEDAEDKSRADPDDDDKEDSFYKNYILTLGFESESGATLVKLNDEYKVFEEDEYLTLDSVLPGNFMGKSVKIIGSVYEKIDRYPDNAKSNTLQYKAVHWSVPAKVKVKENDKLVDSIVVSKTTAEESEFDFNAPVVVSSK